MANNRKLIKLLLVANIVYICVGFTSTRSPGVHQSKNKSHIIYSTYQYMIKIILYICVDSFILIIVLVLKLVYASC